jgi:8-oxo-dGTP pyrophosphatase MutT (NUDIX family)
MQQPIPSSHQPFLDSLLSYQPESEAQREIRERFLDFVRSESGCFERTQPDRHITGSAWLVDPAGEKVLLTHHAKLDKWLQLGGHADGESDILAVALREAQEESGLTDLVALSAEIFDLDIHPIPGKLPHHHYDVRFCLEARGTLDPKISRESEEALLRMGRKWSSWRKRFRDRNV